MERLTHKMAFVYTRARLTRTLVSESPRNSLIQKGVGKPPQSKQIALLLVCRGQGSPPYPLRLVVSTGRTTLAQVSPPTPLPCHTPLKDR
jgi:hypothetical protein